MTKNFRQKSVFLSFIVQKNLGGGEGEEGQPVPFHGFLETLPVLWKKIFFVKRCAFQSFTRICKKISRHSENKPVIETKR
jgi:hypothetical protein